MRISKRRALIAGSGVLVVGAAGLIVAGSTFGFFSATATGLTNTFSAGKVSLSQSAASACTVTKAQPGDFGTCTMTVTYTGTVSGGAYLALDVTVTGTAGSPVTPYGAGSPPTAANGLYNGTAKGLQLTITSTTGAVTYMTGTTLGGTATTSGSASASATDLLVNKVAVTSATKYTFKVHWSLPTTATNAFDTAGSTVKLLVHAVQAANNGSTATCTAGKACSGAGDPAWS